MLTTVGRLREALSIGERLRTLEPFVPIYTVVTARSMQENGQNAASIPILEAMPPNSAGGIRSSTLANAYAAEGRFAEAADTLLLAAGMLNLNPVSRREVEDAARLLRSAPTKVSAPASLPVLGIGLNFVYAYVGALPRVMEVAERSLATGYNVGGSSLWLPAYAPLRKTERFKAYARKAGLVDYWRAHGWPDLCRPQGADDFVCD